MLALRIRASTKQRGPAIAFIYAESLIELAIRIGVDDLVKDPESVVALLGIEPCIDAGMNLTPPLSDNPVYDKTLFDEFQSRLSELQRLKGEQGLQTIFRNNIPANPDIQEYLSRGPNVRFVHGYPRESQDLPCIAITLGGESEGGKYLGQLKYVPVRRSPKGVVVRQGSDMESDYHIHILTPNYDETVILFHLVKYGLLKYRDHLEGYGIREATMHWQPCEPAPDYLQGGLFMYQRTCVLSLVKDESFEYTRPGYSELEYEVSVANNPDIIIVDRQVIPPGPDEGFLP